MKRHLIKLLFLLPLIALAVAIQGSHTAHATTDPGRIIDDAVFDNQNSMSAGAIQSWLQTNYPNGCLTNYQAPDPTGQFAQPSAWDSFGGDVPASQVIADTAHIWGINPQVILTTLEKEEGLVSGHGAYGCASIAYETAMGYDCPGPIQSSTGTCVVNSDNLGFSAQVDHGAWQLEFGRQRSEGNGNLGWDGDNDVPYYGYMTQGTRARCEAPCENLGSNYTTPEYNSGSITLDDGTALTVENGATASLYSYTPFLQSFGTIFTGWFGSPYAEQNAVNANWSFEKLDGSSDSVSTRVGTTGQTPTPISFGSDLYVFYYDRGQGVLREAYSDTNGWHFQVLDGAGGSNGQITANVGAQVKPIVYNGVIYLFYYDSTDGALREAYSDTSGQNWTFRTLDGGPGTTLGGYHDNVGQNPTPVVYGSSLQLFYHDATNGDLRHAWYDGTNWHFENLDGDIGSIAGHVGNVGQGATAVVYGSSLQLFYYDASNGDLRHAWSAPVTGWHFENLDGDIGSIAGRSANVGMWPTAHVYGSSLQLFYYDATNGELRHAWTGPAPWQFENLDGDPGSIGHSGDNTGLMSTATDYNGVLYLFYYDATTGALRAAYSDTTGWHFATLDGTYYSVSGFTDNLGMDPGVTIYNGVLQLYYYDASNSTLRHAWAVAP
jgi:hypothetical protein